MIERTSVRAQVRQILRAQVASGTLAPGEIHSALTLANQLGVSATPVREAMLDLVSAGLVEALPNRGFRVLSISAADLDEIVTLRIWLEVPALEPVIALATDAQLAALRPLAESIVEAADRRDVARFMVADSEFHAALLSLASNQRLLRMVSDLRDQTQLLGLRRLGQTGQLGASAVEHLEILDALKARDVDHARALMTRHLEHSRGIWAGVDEA